MRRRENMILKTIKDKGLKITPQRQLIGEVLDGNKTHPSAEDVYNKVVKVAPTVSIATVYKTLNSLADLGVIQRLDVGDGKAHFDPDLTPHSHFVCLKCKKIFDISTTIPLPDLGEDFKVVRAQAVYYGYCKKCQELNKGEE
jgi:Fur family peroxide stress response transcriptional regulator